MTIPRSLNLVTIEKGIRLLAKPVIELETLRNEAIIFEPTIVSGEIES